MKLRKIVEDIKEITAVEPAAEMNAEVSGEIPPAIETPQEMPSEEIMTNAFSESVQTLVQNTWDYISNVASVLATVDEGFGGENKEEIKTILNGVMDDATITVGMLTKVIELIDNKTTSLLDAGIEKASDIISEPASDLAD